MHILKSQVVFVLLTLTGCSFSMAQNIGSIKVSGKVQWRDATITGYPPKLKIISPDRQVYFCPINSTGSYTCNLPAGTYQLTTSQHYFWMGDAYIRINDAVSNIPINVSPQQEFTSPVLVLDIIALPGKIPRLGVALNFNNRNARLLNEYIKKQMAYFEIPGASWLLYQL